MGDLRSEIVDILNEIDDEIAEYEGDNLIDAGLLDSFAIITIMAMIEDRLHITISPENVKEDNFKTIDAIVKLAERSRQ
ncbi:hypothetical protein B6K86_02000 [Lachnospiraceae bacterium]|nr:hypothetical protein B6K86_02000 [Lachnospiraceae bacterium]